MEKLVIPTKCDSALDAQRKTAALVKIAANMDADALGILATLSAKPGANTKLKNNKTVLLSFI